LIRGSGIKPDTSVSDAMHQIEIAHARVELAERRIKQLLTETPKHSDLEYRIDKLEAQQDVLLEWMKAGMAVEAGLKMLVTASTQLGCGGLAGVVARTATAPFDRVKILMQTQTAQKGETSFIKVGADVMKQEGVKGLWRGNGVNCLKVFPKSAIQFATYDMYKEWMTSTKGKKKLTWLERLGGASFSGLISATVTHPLELIRTRLSVNPNLVGMRGAYTDILAENGVRSLAKGYPAAVAATVPFGALSFAINDTLKDLMLGEGSNKATRPFAVLLCGSVAGLFAQTICYPADTVSKRMQLKNHTYKNTVDCFRTIVKTEGPKALYKGMVPNALKIMPMSGIRFLAYDVLKWLVGLQS